MWLPPRLMARHAALDRSIGVRIPGGQPESFCQGRKLSPSLGFDLTSSHLLADRIAGIDDVQRLKELHRAAVQVSGLEAFSQLLDQEPN